MTREQIFETARTFFGKTLRVDARQARVSLKSAGTNFHHAVVAIDFGARHFEVEISRYDNRIKLVEITTHNKFRFDHRNPLNGYALKEERSERVIRNHRLEGYLLAENND
ncbi:hypothetical protein KML24007_03950 [Alistipes indistinctus]|uniref:hypothetical protein n=1 Tax=Alistipes indistinctus TaxID=626932 RepID=UPI0036F26EBD